MSDISIYDLVGKRVKLIEMFDDVHPVEPGTEGKVMSVGMDVISVDWDNGRVLGMIWDLDEYEVIG
jgi:RNase P/RNase MRP subunit p29